MIFKGNPLEAFSLSRLVQFNHIGEFTTEDEALIEEMKEKGFEVVGEENKAKKETVKETKEEKEDDGESDIVSLRKEYEAKMGKKPFAGRTSEQIKEKMQ